MSHSPCTFTKENLNFQLPPQRRACFYEDIDLKSSIRTIDVFIHSSNDMQVQLAIYGPLDYKAIVSVRRRNFLFLSLITIILFSTSRSNLKMRSRQS